MRSLLSTFGGIFNVLQLAYPSHTWDASKFKSKQKKSKQWRLRSVVEAIFPNTEILEETSGSLSNSSTDLRFDVYLPSLKIAFEYDGEQHYGDVSHHGQQKHTLFVFIASFNLHAVSMMAHRHHRGFFFFFFLKKKGLGTE
jgi:hypothetical protein